MAALKALEWKGLKAEGCCSSVEEGRRGGAGVGAGVWGGWGGGGGSWSGDRGGGGARAGAGRV